METDMAVCVCGQQEVTFLAHEGWPLLVTWGLPALPFPSRGSAGPFQREGCVRTDDRTDKLGSGSARRLGALLTEEASLGPFKE